MSRPDYLSYFFRAGQTPFQVLPDLEDAVAEEILKKDTLWRADGTYLSHRKRHERVLREKFVAKGGRPVRSHPIYMILGDSPAGPHDLRMEYDFKIVIPLDRFSAEEISFTYPDSLYQVPLEDLGKLYLERCADPAVYRVEEIEGVIERYQVYEQNNHYVEAQVWVDRPLVTYRDRRGWEACRAAGSG